MDSAFYTWSLSEAWSWLINIPVIGFIGLIILGFMILAIGVAITQQ